MEINNILYIPKRLNQLFFGDNNYYSKYFIYLIVLIAIVSLAINTLKKIVFTSWFVLLVGTQVILVYLYYKIREYHNKKLERNNFKELSELCKKKDLNLRKKKLCDILNKTTKNYNKIGRQIEREFYN